MLSLFNNRLEVSSKFLFCFNYLDLLGHNIKIVDFNVHNLVSQLFIVLKKILNPEICNVIASTKGHNLYFPSSFTLCLNEPLNDLAD